jgi:hypothetical protein
MKRIILLVLVACLTFAMTAIGQTSHYPQPFGEVRTVYQVGIGEGYPVIVAPDGHEYIDEMDYHIFVGWITDSCRDGYVWQHRGKPPFKNKYASAPHPELLDRLGVLQKQEEWLTRVLMETRTKLDSLERQFYNEKMIAQFNTGMDNIYIRKLDSLIEALRAPVIFIPTTSSTYFIGK